MASALCATHDVEVCIVDAKADIDIVMGMWRTLVLQLYECETLGSEEQQAIVRNNYHNFVRIDPLVVLTMVIDSVGVVEMFFEVVVTCQCIERSVWV